MSNALSFLLIKPKEKLVVPSMLATQPSMTGTSGMPAGGGRDRKRSPKVEVWAAAIVVISSKALHDENSKNFFMFCISGLPQDRLRDRDKWCAIRSASDYTYSVCISIG